MFESRCFHYTDTRLRIQSNENAQIIVCAFPNYYFILLVSQSYVTYDGDFAIAVFTSMHITCYCPLPSVVRVEPDGDCNDGPMNADAKKNVKGEVV